MKIDETHKTLLKEMGLVERDFERFDGKFVHYEFDEVKGVRIYDPYYMTSYEEYIGVDGWSAWSSENDTFMSDILKKTRETVAEKKAQGPAVDKEDVSEALRKKFPGKVNPDPQ